jgi:hypothetical protein
MPFCMLTASSTLLAPDGWLRVGKAPKEMATTGIDRHGALKEHVVTLEVVHDEVQGCYIGTRASVGAFHPSTLLLDSEGRKRSAGSIVELDVPSALKFECATIDLPGHLSDRSCDHVWEELSRSAAIRLDSGLLFKSRRASLSRGAKLPGWLKRQANKGDPYFALEKSGFIASLQSKGITELADFAIIALANQEGVIEAERPCFPLLLWIILGLRRAKRDFRFAYDSIQHSTLLGITLEEKSGGIEQVRTAFVGEGSRAAKLIWDDKSWSPVSSGFVVVGQ